MKYELKYQHVLAEVLSSPWAILPETLKSITSVLAFRAAGHELGEEEILSRVGELRTDREPYAVTAEGRSPKASPVTSGAVMVIPIYGVIGPKASQFERASSGGGTGIDALTQTFRSALSNPDISAIVFDVDSPGGSVFGIAELADEIYAGRGKKKIVAQVAPRAASAAYWLAASAGEVVVTPSGQAGSIGVFVAHEDLSKALDMQGVKETLISAGKYKVEGASSQPLSDEARAAMQNMVDQYYGAFVQGVARGRAVTAATVRNSFGEGRVVSAQDALQLGMVDRIATLDQTIAALLGGRPAKSASAQVPVSVPAASVAEKPASAEITEEATMATAPTPAAGAAEINVLRDVAIASEEQRVKGITALARHASMTDKLSGWLREGKTIDAVSEEIVDLQKKGAKPVNIPAPGAQVDLNDREQRQYSILRAVRSMVLAQKRDEKLGSDTDASFEREVSDTIAKKLNRETSGIYIPTNLRATVPGLDPKAVLNSGSSPGTNFVQTTIRPDEFIDLLRNRLVVMKMGARKLGDLQGNLQLPKQTAAATLYWTGENPGSAVTATDQTTGSVTLSPKQAMAQTAYSRQFIIQSSIDAEQFVREDLANIFALGVDLAALVGSGTSNQPKGIVNQSGVGTEAIATDGGAITYSIITKAQEDLEESSIPLIAPGIATTPGVKKKLRNTAELSNTISLPIWHSDDTVAGYPAMSSNQLPSNTSKGSGTNLHTMIVGDWAQLILGEWGALEIIADPYTQAGKGNVVLTGSMLVDIAVRYAQAFVVINDINPTS
ncbi:peptidase S49 [Candidatus Koribacter versatilis Ellin345]|uniref:Peptidase S49 n=1 Tax=Koribacter versatilis (strain Ellin345) TaxID=204669 RepID=Q1ILS6_KORVE|nr:phage major capsid protein [Candidatus Koribacter versatilis]ABF42174.1 peptidase S49 [Candidatus Koribacter versatilis Ellin345]